MDLKNTKLYEMEFICNMIDITCFIKKVAEDCGFYGSPEEMERLYVDMLLDAAKQFETLQS